MNSFIINWLNSNFGYRLKADYYSQIEEWEHWYEGYYEPFHRVTIYDGRRHHYRDMYSLKIAKKICEDWASLLINDKTSIKIDDEYTSRWLQGDNRYGGILGANNFREQLNDLMEKMMYSGTAAIIARLNAAFNKDRMLMFNKNNKISLVYLAADNIIPLSVDNGVITEAAFCSKITVMCKEKIYLELHILYDGEYRIENHIFGTDTSGGIREEDLPDNVPSVIHTGSNTPWFCICKPAIVNNISDSNGLGCSIFANAIDNLKGVDIAYNNLNNDLRLGQKKVFMSQPLISEVTGGGYIAPDDVNQQLFYCAGTTLNDIPLIQEYNPNMRIADNTAGIQAQLDYLSLKVGFGTKHYKFSNDSIVTATQYTGDKQDLIQNVHKHFIKVESFMQSLLRMLLHIGHIYIDKRIKSDTNIEIIFDQSPLIDENAERSRDLSEVSAGLMMPWEYRMKWFGESEKQAKAVFSTKESF